MIGRRTWWLLVGGAVGVSLAIRIGLVLARPHLVAAGDPAEYLGQANLLVSGHGWIEPYAYQRSGAHIQVANLPPFYTMLQALCSIWFKSFFAHRIWSAFLSTAGVVLAALLGRDLVGPRVGLLAAFGYALYPNLAMSSAVGMSETVSPVMVLLVLFTAYRYWRDPSLKRAVALGLAIGFAALTRDELLVLVPLLLLPLMVREWRRLLIGLLAIAAVVGPWVAFNSIRFSRPVLITDRLGATLSVANCDQTYQGRLAGFWEFACQDFPGPGVSGPSIDAVDQHRAEKYISGHLGQLPKVELERLGRTFGFYEPAPQIRLDIQVESRPAPWAWTGLGVYYALLACSGWGAWQLRRRGIPLFPLAAVAIEVIGVSLVTYGNTRFRAPLEPVLILLAAVTVADGFDRVTRRRSDQAVDERRSVASTRSVSNAVMSH